MQKENPRDCRKSCYSSLEVNYDPSVSLINFPRLRRTFETLQGKPRDTISISVAEKHASESRNNYDYARARSQNSRRVTRSMRNEKVGNFEGCFESGKIARVFCVNEVQDKRFIINKNEQTRRVVK